MECFVAWITTGSHCQYTTSDYLCVPQTSEPAGVLKAGEAVILLGRFESPSKRLNPTGVILVLSRLGVGFIFGGAAMDFHL